MTSFFQRYATPFITGFFLISLISGVILFFHVGPNGFREMHEILSLVLIIPFVLHLWKNWRPMVAYFRRAPMVIALVASAAIAGLFLLPSSETTAGGPPQFQLFNRLMAQDVDTVAPVLGVDATAVTTALITAGFAVTGPDEALKDIATASGKSDAELAAVLAGLGA